MSDYGVVSALVAMAFCCGSAWGEGLAEKTRAGVVPISTTGSLQNPCFSPDGSKLVFTRFRKGYNEGLSDIMLVDVAGGRPVRLSTFNAQNVNLPGACWDAKTNRIAFSADPGAGDQIYVVAATGGPARQVTHFTSKVAWEPSFSPDGQWITFEVHDLNGGDDSPGSIWKVRAAGGKPVQLTSGADDRQPNWSPRGDLIVFQRLAGTSTWDLFTVTPIRRATKNVTRSRNVEETDASFSPDGRYIVYSSDRGGLDLAGLWLIPSGGVASGKQPIRIGKRRTSYDGAPSISPNRKWVVFETARGDPDGSAGTKLEILPMPVLP